MRVFGFCLGRFSASILGGIALGVVVYTGYNIVDKLFNNADPFSRHLQAQNVLAQKSRGRSVGSTEFNPQVVIDHPFPAITEFPTLAASEVGDRLQDNELVLGVVVNGKPRAYPINMLTGPRREILNDTLGGRPIAATW